MKISIIVAVAKNNVIGGKGKLLWRIPQDLKNFKKITLGHHILMGQ
ncbi:MAG: dihydrofolate reductase, partial [Candidatus Woesebacteria bacterium GW2011_GWE2_31_6]